MRFPPVAVFLALVAAEPFASAADPTAYPGLTYHGAPRSLAPGAKTDSWAHFLGPAQNATTTETPLLKAWPQGGPKLVWEMESGEGYACPTFGGGRLVYFHRVEGKETVDCLDPETGKRYWRFDYPVQYEDRYGFSPGPRASAVIDEGRVYTAGVTAMLHCLDLATGKVVWKRNLAAEYDVPQNFFGYGPTPCVWRDRLIVNVGGQAEDRAGVCVAAFDKTTGKPLWETRDPWGASYASPIVARLRGREVALVIAAGESRPSHGGLLTLDLQTGKILDRFPWRARNYESVVAGTPLVLDDRRVFISECYEKGGTLLEFDADLKSKQLWTQRGFGLHWTMPLLLDGHLYGFAGRNPPDTEFKCVDAATGEIKWTDDTQFREGNRIASFFRGTLLRAGNRIFAIGEEGLLGEFELSPKGAVLRQRARMFLAQSTWTLPALHRGLLYVRQNERDVLNDKPARVLCYDLRGE